MSEIVELLDELGRAIVRDVKSAGYGPDFFETLAGNIRRGLEDRIRAGRVECLIHFTAKEIEREAQQ
jgi:uncharacterized protein YicC (UPF0701 family)